MICLLLFSSWILTGCNKEATEDPADLVIWNARVLTVDSGFSIAEAVAVKDGKFIAVGDWADLQGYVGNGTRVVDAGGKTMIPGLFESHNHATSVVRRDLAAGRPFRQLESIGEIQEWVAEQARQTPPGEWIRLPRVDVTRIREGRIPASSELDTAAPDHPAVFIWQYADRQIQILNTAAMQAAGITAGLEGADGCRILTGQDGMPTGRLEDCPELTRSFLQPVSYTREEYLEGLERLFHEYNKLGITSITDRGTGKGDFEDLNDLHARGRLSLRTTLTMYMRTIDGSAEDTERAIRDFAVVHGQGNDHVRVGSLKFRMDGGVLYGTAFMREPYGESAFELYGIDDHEYRGRPAYSPQEVQNIMYTGHNKGWQMSVHVTGDAGVDRILDAIEVVNARSDEDMRRFTLTHAYFAHPETAERAARLGVGVDTQPAWYYLDADALLDALGEERMKRFIGLQNWQKNGTRITINSDHMQGFDPVASLNPYHPFLTMYTAISRKTTGGQVIGSDQKVTREDALRMMTVDAAWFSFDEDKLGSIEAGKLADFAILSDHYLQIPEEDIPGIYSLLTVVGGEVVYEAENSTLKHQWH